MGKISTRVAILFSVDLLLFIGVILSNLLNISTDEGFAFHTTGFGPSYAWMQSIDFEAQPPFYFVLESIWRMLNEYSILWARLPSVFFACGAVALITLAVKRVAPNIHPLIVSLLTALNPIVIWAAVEMRVYALVLFIAAGLTWTLVEGFLLPNLVQHKVWLYRLGYTLFAIAGLYTQYYLGFILAAHFLTVLFFTNWKMLRIFILSMVVTIISFVPFVGVVINHVKNAGNMDSVIKLSLPQLIHQFADIIFLFILPHNEFWTGKLQAGVICLFVILSLTIFFINKPKFNEVQIKIGIQWFLCLIVFIGFFAVLSTPFPLMRHIIALVPSTLVVAFIVMSSITKWKNQFYSVIIVLFAVLASTEYLYEYNPMTKPGDWQRAAKIVSMDKTIPVVVFPIEERPAIDVYLPDDVNPISIPKPMTYGLDYIEQARIPDELTVTKILDPVTNISSFLWVVSLQECHEPNENGYNFNCRFLQNYLNKNYHLVYTRHLRGTLVKLYQTTKQISFPQVTLIQ